LLNFSFIFAGSTSSNPLLIIMEGMIAFWAWRSAGWFGLDRFLLPLIGTPWAPGPLLGTEERATARPRPSGGG
jgi:thiosulfate dehydrogenase [quinone] large subunit